MNDFLKKNGIYVMMCVGVTVLSLASFYAADLKGIQESKISKKKKVESSSVLQDVKMNSKSTFILGLVVLLGLGIGLTSDLLLMLRRIIKKASISGDEAPEPSLIKSMPWTLPDMGRIAIVFIFFMILFSGLCQILIDNNWFGRPAVENISIVLSTVGIYAVMLTAIYKILIKGYSEKIAGIGLSLHGFFSNAMKGVIGYFAFIPMFFVLLITSLVLCNFSGIKAEPHALVEIFAVEKSVYKIIFLSVVAVVFAPIYEEVVFRGFIYASLRNRFGAAVGMIASASFFALIHFNVAQFIPVLGLGLVLAYLYEKTGTLVASMIFHALNNGIAVILTLFVLHNMK